MLQQFGGAHGGLPKYPASNIIYYDDTLDKFYVDDLLFWNDESAAQHVHCDSTGDIKFGIVRNSSGWAAGCTEGNDLSMGKCNSETVGSKFPPKRGYVYYRIKLDTADVANAGLNVDQLSVMMNSTNPEIISQGMEDVDYEGVEEDSLGTKRLVLKLHPKLFAVGSTTLSVTVTCPTSGKVGIFKFTYNNIAHTDCPYRVKFLASNIRPITFSTFVLSISVGGQAILYFSIASFGDFGPFRKLLLCYCSLIGCVCTMAIITCTLNEHYLRCAWLTILSNMACGGEGSDSEERSEYCMNNSSFRSIVVLTNNNKICRRFLVAGSMLFYCAFLPYLSRSHPRFLDAKFEYKNLKSGAATGVGAASKKLLATYHDVCDHVSAEGYFWGYVSGCFSMLLAIAIIFIMPSLDGMRMIIFISGFYWLIFSLPLFMFLHTRPGPDFPDDFKGNPLKGITFSWRRIFGSAYAIRHLPETKRFLIAYFFFSDGINTISNVAILFAMQDLGMSTFELTILAAEAPFFGALGVKIYRWWQLKHDLSSKQMLLRGIWLLMTIPLYGSIGYLSDYGLNVSFGMVQKVRARESRSDEMR